MSHPEEYGVVVLGSGAPGKLLAGRPRRVFVRMQEEMDRDVALGGERGRDEALGPHGLVVGDDDEPEPEPAHGTSRSERTGESRPE